MTVRFAPDAIVISGVMAGLVFATFEILAAAALQGAAATPFRMIAAIVIGAEALDPSYSVTVAVMTGMGVHLVLSVLFTAVFAAMLAIIATLVGAESVTRGNLAFTGVAFGIALWMVNFQVVAPTAGWIWFSEPTDLSVQLLAHAVFFGWPMGWMLAHSEPASTLTV